ncbi:MAG: hypothetical protein ACM30H_04530 [Clostridia bacterium]
MLRSFLKRFEKKPQALRIALCEDRIFVSGQEAIPLLKAEDAPNWRAAVDALPGVIAGMDSGEINIVLADQFVRYALLPWSDTLKTHAQWMALARHRFCAIHGPLANEWEIKFAETAPAGPRLACAVDAPLVDALAEKFSGTGVQLVSVLPFLVAAFNRVRHMTGGSCWLIIEEPGRLTLALFLRGVWVAIRSRRADEHWRESLPEMIARESALLGLDEPCTRVIVCAQGPFTEGEMSQSHEDFRLDALPYQELAVAGH